MINYSIAYYRLDGTHLQNREAKSHRLGDTETERDGETIITSTS